MRRIARRPLFHSVLGGVGALLATPRPATSSTSDYHVGIGVSTNAYAATLRAIQVDGGWPAARIAGHTVIIKPNLVFPRSAETGVTTDPQLVRALVDLALAAGAAKILIVESGIPQAHFSACGYDFFNTYDPGGRIAMVNLHGATMAVVPVVGGLAYRWMYLPRLLFDKDAVFISAAKMKCHGLATATLTMKNMYGLPSPKHYYVSTGPRSLMRNTLHLRGMDQSTVDLTMVRPIDFAVVDGIWAMEGDGPISGSPVRMNMVIAGSNAVAVDRVCLNAMGIPQDRVLHLEYASQKALGPPLASNVTVRGDSYSPRAFNLPPLPPPLWYPAMTPNQIVPSSGQRSSIAYRVGAASLARVDIVQNSEFSPAVTHVRSLGPWTPRPPGTHTVEWDGRDDAGQIVAAGTYTAQVQAVDPSNNRLAYATGRVVVAA